MSDKSAFEAAKAKLKETYLKFFPETVKKFIEVKTSDGKMLQYEGDMPAVGMPINMGDDSGNYSPAPDGDYTIEDGSVISVKDGMITAIAPGQGQEDATEETKLSKLEAQIAKLEIAKEIARHKDEIDQLKAKQSSLCSQEDYDKLKAELAEQKTENANQKEFMKQIFELVEKIGETESEETKTAKKKDAFKKAAKAVDIKAELAAFRKDLEDNAR